MNITTVKSTYELKYKELYFNSQYARTRFKNKLTDKTPNASANLWSNTSASWDSTVFVPNPDFWAIDLKEQLTGISVWKSDGWNQSGGGTLITSRHCLSSVYGAQTGDTIRFASTELDSNGHAIIFETTILKSSVDLNSSDKFVVWLLADEAPSWVHRCPIADISSFDISLIGCDNADMPLVCVSQGNDTASNDPLSTERYGTPNGIELYLDHINFDSQSFTSKFDQTLNAFHHNVSLADEGTPRFIYLYGNLYLFNQTGGEALPTLVDEIQSVITQVNQFANITGSYIVSHIDINTARDAAYLRLRDVAYDSAYRRIAGKNPQTCMPIFSNTTSRWDSNIFIRNANLWCADIADQLTGRACWKSGGWTQSYGPIAITKKHCLSCGHNGPPVGTRIRFANVGGNGQPEQIFETTIIQWVRHQFTDFNFNFKGWGFWTSDMSIYLLADDLPEWASINKVVGSFYGAPLWDHNHKNFVTDRKLSKLDIPYPVMSQGNWINTIERPGEIPLPFSDTPNGCVMYISYDNAEGNDNPSHPFYAYHRDLKVGDSGTDQHILLNDTLLTFSIISGSIPGRAREKLELFISLADEKAIKAGQLTAPTGYLPDWADLADYI